MRLVVETFKREGSGGYVAVVTGESELVEGGACAANVDELAAVVNATAAYFHKSQPSLPAAPSWGFPPREKDTYCGYRLGVWHTHQAVIKDLLRGAQLMGRKLEIEYRDGDGATTARSISVSRVKDANVLAYDHLRDAPRTFAIARINRARLV